MNDFDSGPPDDRPITIEGGEVDLDEQPDLFHMQHRAETARKLAYILVGTLAGSFLLHYLILAALLLGGDPATASTLTDLFNTWLPVISGLTGGAVTYYFTRGK